MNGALRFGRYEIRRGSQADPSLPRRRVASASDAVAFLRQLGVGASLAARLVRALGTSGARASDGDMMRALGALLWRGAYVIIEHPSQVRVPLTEISAADDVVEEPEPQVAEGDADEGHPPPLVCYEYPRVASYIALGVDAAVAMCKVRLDEQLFYGLAGMPVDVVPLAYRELAKDKQREIDAAAHRAIVQIERLLHQGEEISSPPITLPEVYREVADNKRAQIVDLVGQIADRLSPFAYMGDIELARTEGGLHTNALPPVLRENVDRKVATVRESTEIAAGRLDALLYDGFTE